jgi:hypothetical protein
MESAGNQESAITLVEFPASNKGGKFIEDITNRGTLDWNY